MKGEGRRREEGAKAKKETNRFRSTELGDGSIEHVDVVEEVDD